MPSADRDASVASVIRPRPTIHRGGVPGRVLGTALVALFPVLAPSQATAADAVERILGPVAVSSGQVAVQQTPVATHDGKVYVAHVVPGPSGDGGGRTDLGTVVRMGATGPDGGFDWQQSTIESRTVHDRWHTPPSVGVDERGFVHVAYNMHNLPWQYSISSAPGAIDGFEFRGQDITQAEIDRAARQNKTSFPSLGSAAIPGNQITYPAFYNDLEGKLYVSYRFAARPARRFAERMMSSGVAGYDAESGVWSSIGGTIDASSGGDFRGGSAKAEPLRAIASQAGRTSYSPRLTFAPDGGFTVSSTWRFGTAGPHAMRPCAVTTRDGRDFTTPDGRDVRMPITSDDCGNIDGTSESGYYSIGDVAADAAGHHHVLLSPRSGPRQIHAWDGSGWTREKAPMNATEIFFDADDNLWALGTGPRIHVKRAGSDAWDLVFQRYSGRECFPRAALDAERRVAYVHTTGCDRSDASVWRADLQALLQR